MKDAELDALLAKNPGVDKEVVKDFVRRKEDLMPKKKGPELPAPYGGKRMVADETSTWSDAPAIHYRSR